MVCFLKEALIKTNMHILSKLAFARWLSAYAPKPPRRYPDSGGPGKFYSLDQQAGDLREASWIKSVFS